MPLPHFLNSHISTSNAEPVYLNLFDVAITPPTSFPISDTKLLIESVKKITGLEVDKMPALVEQQFRGAKRRFIGSLPDSTTLDVNIEFEVNLDESGQMTTYEFLRAWSDLCWGPQDGFVGSKVDYAGGAQLTIQMNDRNGVPFRQIICYNVFPMTPINPMELDYSSGTNIYTVNCTFAVDYWEVITT